MYTLATGRQVKMQVTYADAAGQAATVDGAVTWTSSDDSVASVEADTGDSTIATVTGEAPGQAEITATADADLSTGTRPLPASFGIEVVAGEAVIGTITPLDDNPLPPDPQPEPSDLRGWELDETNTGLAAHGIDPNSLPRYGGPSKLAAGTVLERVLIDNPEVICCEGDIILRDCLVRPSAPAGRAGIIFGLNPDTGGNQKGDVIIEYCDIDASHLDGGVVYAQCAFRGAGTLRYCNIWGMGSGIAYFGDAPIEESLIEHCYVHDLRGGMYGNPPQQSHNESATVRRFPGRSLKWIDNRLESKSGSDSGSQFLQANGWFDHILLEGNSMAVASGYVLVLEASSGGYGNDMRCLNNRFTKASYGNTYVDGGPGWAEWVDNYELDFSAPDGKGAIVNQPGVGAKADDQGRTIKEVRKLLAKQ